MTERIDKQRLFAYFAGQATALEKQQIEEWSRILANEEQFYNWLDEWEQSHLQYTTDHPEALHRYHRFLFADQPNDSPSAANKVSAIEPVITEPNSPSFDFIRRRNWQVWAVAASVALVVGLFVFREQLLTRTYTTGYGETRSLTLPDGSAVMLNANSTLRLARFGFGQGFGKTTREVRLTGEALFTVTHKATHQRFVVKTHNGPEVVVLGTEFTVFARPRGTKVVLNRGKVEVHYEQSDHRMSQVTMKPGDLVMFSPKGDVQRQQLKQPPANPAWTDHRFVFEQTPLTEVVAMLSENYGLTVEIADAETGQLTLSGAYPAQNADELLRIIAEVLNIDIIRQSDKRILTQKPLQ